MTNLHIAVVDQPHEPAGTEAKLPKWLRIARKPGSPYDELPGFGAYGRALLTNDLVAENQGAVVLLAGGATVAHSEIVRCLRLLEERPSSDEPFSWSDEFDRLCGVGATSVGVLAIKRFDWDRLGGLAEFLPFGFIGDLERRARAAGILVARIDGRIGDEATADDHVAYGLTLISRTGASSKGRAAAKNMIRRLIRDGQLSRRSAAEAIRSASSAARDVRHLKTTPRDRSDR